MQNIVPTRVLARRSRNLLVASGLLMLFGILVFAIGGALFAIELVVADNPNFEIYNFIRSGLVVVGIIICVVAIGLVIRAFTWRTDNELALRTGDALAQELGSDYILIRNVSKRGLGYIDAVLVGPAGVLVLRITSKVGVLFNEGGYWLEQSDKSDWKALRWNPTKEVITDVNKLKKYLANKKLPDLPIFAAIVFVQNYPAVRWNAENPKVPSVYPDDLKETLTNSYFAKDRIDKAVVTQVVRSLYN